MKYVLPLIFLALGGSACTGDRAQKSSATEGPDYTQMTFPEREWPTAAPADLGVDTVHLNAALNYLAGHCKEDGLTETLVLRNGYLIWAGDSIDKVHDIWSCTKSFTSAAVGHMATSGLLELDQPVADHEPRLRDRYPAATYRHFLTMTSGYDATGATRWPGDVSQDWSRTPYDPAPPLFAPGTAYAYWDEAMIMLGRALTHATDQTLRGYLDEHVTGPIGIPSREWWGEDAIVNTRGDSVKINFGGTGLRLSASEHARFGHLMLNRGRWKNDYLLDGKYAKAALEVQVPITIPTADTDRQSTDGSGRYGYNWWIIPEGADGSPVHAAFTSGLNHNVCLVVPEWGLVLVRQGVDGNPGVPKHEVYAEVLRLLGAGVSALGER